ncbi:alkaline phosphatase [Amphritea balenae]|uniref:Alkaline phosphatase n=1 Tax=Amphritea balenae TaxID=452629 RepID=A0A3P1SWT0_9GAMM|nr:alkaline phosphatase [Amphritea balenae]RRD01590.1 alkaline phosphatase [Amphritea balenae]GGK55707.1 alkaline phosphatase [Amphritea balenae]
MSLSKWAISLGAAYLSASCAYAGEIKNVIVVIGDGMGPQQIGLLNSYVKHAPNSTYKGSGRISAWESLANDGVLGLAYTDAANVLVTDSAASATQFASGKMSGSEMIGADEHGNATETMLELAEKMGKSTGLISDTRVTHATPAGFAAHQTHRSKENEIAGDMLNNQVDVLLGGGLRHWIPKSANDKDGELHAQLKEMTSGAVRIKSKRKDERNLLDEANNQGYQLAFTKEQMQAASGDKLLGLFAYSRALNGIEESHSMEDPKRTSPTLQEMTEKAVSVLERNDEGFFLMVESGLIDWAAHDNDTGYMLHEMLKMDRVVKYLHDWAKDRDDTLIIVTADHETGGFGFSYSRNNLPEGRDLPGDVFKNQTFKPNYNFGQHDTLDKIYQQTASYEDIFGKFDSLAADKQTPAALAELVNSHTEFAITEKEAEKVLETEPNEYYVEGHGYLGTKTFPKVNEFKEFFVYGAGVRHSLLASIVGKQQNTVWATGTHTNTPVPVIAWGPESVTDQFDGLMHTTDWANFAIDAMR